MIIMPKMPPEREEWSPTIKTISHVLSGVLSAVLGVLIWPPTNWKLWAWIALFSLVLANERTIAEGRKVE